MNKKTFRFSEETMTKLTELAIAQSVLEQKQISNTEMLRKLINKAYNKLKRGK